LEGSIEGWVDDVAGLCILRESLSSGLSADDLTVLHERLILLQRQWEETCHQVHTSAKQSVPSHLFYTITQSMHICLPWAQAFHKTTAQRTNSDTETLSFHKVLITLDNGYVKGW